MKIFLGILAVCVVAALIMADYKWRRWMAARRADKDPSVGTPDHHPRTKTRPWGPRMTTPRTKTRPWGPRMTTAAIGNEL